IYSSRPGTKASIMAGQLPETLKQQRSKELHLLSDELKNNFYGQHAGSEQEVLWESDMQDGFMHGFTGNYIRCRKPYDASFINKIEKVRLETFSAGDVFDVSTLREFKTNS
ncbi:MAG: tRNA (N(6)-L-threonylcarbamoyladenosine(37)-C(2))-methylthiotransferase MtaB, partial [Lentimicrobiaceae bacterium]|nr:tRNA (N(6)-L-threonylcarbamoyladenosine(37)-C(2))-methylthiotransferase MtaB [Lentimicrobiaceae bacterium]